MFGIAEEGEEEAFAVADGYTCHAHLFEAVGFVGGVARGGAFGGDVDVQSLRAQVECGLQHADVGFRADEDDVLRVVPADEVFGFGQDGGEAGFFDEGCVLQQAFDFRQGGAEALGVLFGRHHGDAEGVQSLDEECAGGDEAFGFVQGRSQAFLDVDDEAGGVVGTQCHGGFLF
ncbi:hypothetical protein NEIELOOT_01870 [Neisseria elongata subsp. glycolytica ATCC 29315]|uniref:Uncharacterized protein n=1 Tax=Neisseria elongata subsp. glycolytica ATCC 29315 TaxID=546263 RepID=D4DS27_NEIEG|nr:hypothetical protein NEIELOOT_01870 [Neisseria elongata subsp. glycolytica ATCC 29315]